MKNKLEGLKIALDSVDKELNQMFQDMSTGTISFVSLETGIADEKKAFGEMLMKRDISDLVIVYLEMISVYVVSVSDGIITGVLLDENGGDFLSVDFEDILNRDDKIMLLEAIFEARVKMYLRKVEVDCKKENYLDKISGGFAKAIVVGYANECITVRLRSGVQSDVDNDVTVAVFWVTYAEILK